MEMLSTPNPQPGRFQNMTLSQVAALPPNKLISSDDGWYPLHVLCQMNLGSSNEADYLELLGKLLHSFPKATSCFTKEGLLPLHIICRHSVQNISAIELIFECNPEVAKVPTGIDGWYPLHLVSKYSRSVDAIKLIYEAYPKAARKRSEKGNYPHQLLRSNHACQDDEFFDAVITACPLLEASRETMRGVQIAQAIEMTAEELEALSLAGRFVTFSTFVLPTYGFLYPIYVNLNRQLPINLIESYKTQGRKSAVCDFNESIHRDSVDTYRWRASFAPYAMSAVCATLGNKRGVECLSECGSYCD